MLPEGKEGMIKARDVVSRVGRIVFGECIWQISQVLVKYDMYTLQYWISCVTGQILSAENRQNEWSDNIHLAIFFLFPSIEASLAVNDSRTSRKLLCYVQSRTVHDEHYAVAVAFDGIAEQTFFTMGSPARHYRP